MEERGTVLRPYASGDYTAIAALWKKMQMDHIARKDTEEVVERTLSLGGKLILLEVPDGRIIGTAWATTDGRRTSIWYFCVDNDYQGNGYGQRVFEAILKEAESIGLPIKLEADRNNTAAIALFKEFGFNCLGENYDIWMYKR